MDRSMWQDHLVQVSKLFVQHTKLFIHKNGVRNGNGSPAKSRNLQQCIAATRHLDGYDSDFEGNKTVLYLW